MPRIEYLPPSEDAVSKSLQSNIPLSCGEYKFTYENQTVSVPATKGAEMIVRLIRAGSHGHSMWELDQDQNSGGEVLYYSEEDSEGEDFAEHDNMEISSCPSAGNNEKLSDAQAIRSVKREKAKLEARAKELFQAEEPESARLVLDKVAQYQKYLSEVGAPHGRVRAMPNANTTAAKRVRSGIEYALKQIAKAHPALSEHLKANLDLSGNHATYIGEKYWEEPQRRKPRVRAFDPEPIELTDEQKALREAAECIRVAEPTPGVPEADENGNDSYFDPDEDFKEVNVKHIIARVNELLAKEQKPFHGEQFVKPQFRKRYTHVQKLTVVLDKLMRLFPREYAEYTSEKWRDDYQHSQITLGKSRYVAAWWTTYRRR